MKINNLFKGFVLSLAVVAMSACSSHHPASAADGSVVANGADANGAYAQGMGAGSGGFAGTQACSVPETTGFKTQSFYFDYDKSEVKDLAAAQALAQAIATGNSSIRVVGNTDDRGSREYNMALGARRASAIAAALKQDGVGANQVTSKSNGAEKPVAFGTSDQDYTCNRRVDVIYQ